MRDDVDGLAEGWAANGLAPEAIARLALAKRVARLSLVFEQAMKAGLSDLGLTYAEFDVLAALLRAGGRLRPSELAKSLYLTSGGTSNVLQRLTAAGYVAREQNESDARSRWVHLTDKGTQLTEKAMTMSVEVHERVLAAVPPEAITQAAEALRPITARTRP
ncbi:MAG: MarR family transcriptional regulator [Actinomycetota bacterium]|nr:MarR family transcriptional regulator [Actinomycetota bacterium]